MGIDHASDGQVFLHYDASQKRSKHTVPLENTKNAMAATIAFIIP